MAGVLAAEQPVHDALQDVCGEDRRRPVSLICVTYPPARLSEDGGTLFKTTRADQADGYSTGIRDGYSTTGIRPSATDANI